MSRVAGAFGIRLCIACYGSTNPGAVLRITCPSSRTLGRKVSGSTTGTSSDISRPSGVVQGFQLTSRAFTGVLQEAGVAISMDGLGRAIDNVFIERLWRALKYDHVYLNPANSGNACRDGITEFLNYYNEDQPHSSLNDQTPDEVYYQSRINERAA